MSLPSVWLTSSAQGIVDKLGLWQDLSADETGIPTHGRFFETIGTIPHVQVDVTGTGGNGLLTLSNVAVGAPILAGQSVAVQSFSLAEGNQ
jgi:hypothetical protein